MKFYRDWANYKIATRLKDTGHPPANKELGTPTLLTCIGSDALEAYECLDFEKEAQIEA